MAEKQDKPYQPVDRADYDQLDLAVTRQQSLSMQWKDDSGRLCEGRVKPLDLVACKGVEYLNFLYAGEEAIIRLDQIMAFETE